MVRAIAELLDKAVAGERLTPDEGLRLLECHDLAALGRAADAVTRRLHPEPYRTYNIDRNINYTNVCTAVCDFCAFYRKPKDAEGYVLDREVLLEKIQETVDLGGDQILMQGGLHPEFKLEWYEELLARHQAALSAGERPRLQPAGDPPLHQGLEAAAARPCSSGSRPPGWEACRAAGPRFSSIGSARR